MTSLEFYVLLGAVAAIIVLLILLLLRTRPVAGTDGATTLALV